MGEPMRIIVTGWRGARADRHGKVMSDALYPIYLSHEPGDVTLVHGRCKYGGVDLLADLLAQGWGWNREPHPAEDHPDRDFGPMPGAGPRRNKYMCSLGADLVFAFPGPGSRGTWDCLHWAQRYGIPFQGYPLALDGHRGGSRG